MKKLFIITAVCAAQVINAQIPNNGFENWTSIGSYNNPDDWGTLNDFTSPFSVYTCTKGTPGNPGTAYIKLTSKTVVSAVVPGIAVSGTINTSTFAAEGGFPFTQQPTALTGKWQYMASGSDQGFISVYLTKWNTSTNMRDTVAYINYNLPGMVMSWANFSLNLTYLNQTAPDTAMIILSASGANGVTPEASSYLYIDNLAFSGNFMNIETKENEIHLNLYPNPSSDLVRISSGQNFGSDDIISVYDLCGKKMNISYTVLNNEILMNISSLAQGTYFLVIQSENSIARKSFIKQ